MPAISALTNSLTAINAASGDVLPVADVSAVETKKITVQELVNLLGFFPSIIDDGNNAGVSYFNFTHTTTGTPGTGIGVGFRFNVETSAGNNEIAGEWRYVSTDVTGGSEDFKWVLGVQVAGNPTPTDQVEIDSSGINLLSGKNLRVNGTQVVQGRATGWVAMTGTANTGTVYDTATVTLAQLAGRVMAIQAALTTHGLIGT